MGQASPGETGFGIFDAVGLVDDPAYGVMAVTPVYRRGAVVGYVLTDSHGTPHRPAGQIPETVEALLAWQREGQAAADAAAEGR